MVQPSDSEVLRSAMRRWTAGVTVVTAASGDEHHGMTVNSFNSVSLEPAWIAIALKTSTRTCQLVLRAGAFAVTILSEEQQHLADRFSGKAPAGSPEAADRFFGLETTTLATGAPLLNGGLAWLDCRVRQTVPAGENTLFIGEVVAGRAEAGGEPLVYHQRTYRRLAPH